MPTIGIPYARAEVDANGYHVVCPACGLVCRPSPFARRDEDAASKGAAAVYAAHYAAEHEDAA